MHILTGFISSLIFTVCPINPYISACSSHMSLPSEHTHPDQIKPDRHSKINNTVFLVVDFWIKVVVLYYQYELLYGFCYRLAARICFSGILKTEKVLKDHTRIQNKQHLKFRGRGQVAKFENLRSGVQMCEGGRFEIVRGLYIHKHLKQSYFFVMVLYRCLNEKCANRFYL